MKKKMLFWTSFACVLASIGIMALPNGYGVKWCYPDPNWTDTFSYFDTYLLKNLFAKGFFVDLLFVIIIIITPFTCNTIILYQLTFKKFTTLSVVVLVIGLFASFLLIIQGSTTVGHPNMTPLIAVIAAISCGILLLLQLFIKKLTKPAFVVISIGLIASVFSLVKSFWVTIPGLIIAGLLLIAFICQFLYLRPQTGAVKS